MSKKPKLYPLLRNVHCVLLAGAFAGLFFPLVGHDPVFDYIPKPLFAAGMIMGVVYALWLKSKLLLPTQTPVQRALFSFAFFIPGLLFSIGCLMAINGAFDFSPYQFHRTTVLNKYWVKGKHDTAYYVILQDWLLPGGKVKIPASKSLYDDGTEGDTITVETSRGFLGFERKRDIRY